MSTDGGSTASAVEHPAITALLQCPISYSRMEDPVFLNGCCYDRKSLCRWLEDHPKRDPATGITHNLPLMYTDAIHIRQLLMNPSIDGDYQRFDDTQFIASTLQTVDEPWYSNMAANQGHAAAQFDMGLRYKVGCGLQQDDHRAAKYYRMAAQQGHARAQFNLGVMYEEGQGVVQNDAEAVKYYRLAADQGKASAQSNLGVMYLRGRGVGQSDAEAVKYYRLAANQGEGIAQCNLGCMYEKGRGVVQNDAEAFKYFKLAADQGYSAAQCKLGFMYERGKGVGQSDAESVKYYRLAANQGNARAQNHLRSFQPKSKKRPKISKEEK